MKKSAKVTFTVVAVAGLASCGRRHPDPCQAETFNDQACQAAVQSGGYYYQGTWFPMTYHYPYPYYYDSYHTFVTRGGVARPAPAASYGAASGEKPSMLSTPSGPSVERGGFGGSGEAHAAGE